MTGKIKYLEGNVIFVEASDKIIPVFAVYDHGEQYSPIVAGYASAVHKVMGQTLQHITLAFDIRMLSPAVGYVALSKVSSIDRVVPLLRLRRSHFINFERWSCYTFFIFLYNVLISLHVNFKLLSIQIINYDAAYDLCSLTCKYITQYISLYLTVSNQNIFLCRKLFIYLYLQLTFFETLKNTYNAKTFHYLSNVPK